MGRRSVKEGWGGCELRGSVMCRRIFSLGMWFHDEDVFVYKCLLNQEYCRILFKQVLCTRRRYCSCLCRDACTRVALLIPNVPTARQEREVEESRSGEWGG